MKRFYALILLVGLMMPALSGCYHNQIIVEKNYNSSATEPDFRNGWQMYLLAGLIPLGDNPIDMTQACPQGAGIVEVKQSFVNGLVNRLIGFILSFQDVSITCANAPAADAGMAPEEAPVADAAAPAEAPAEEAAPEEAPAE
jgi:hypothetical protein